MEKLLKNPFEETADNSKLIPEQLGVMACDTELDEVHTGFLSTRKMQVHITFADYVSFILKEFPGSTSYMIYTDPKVPAYEDALLLERYLSASKSLIKSMQLRGLKTIDQMKQSMTDNEIEALGGFTSYRSFIDAMKRLYYSFLFNCVTLNFRSVLLCYTQVKKASGHIPMIFNPRFGPEFSILQSGVLSAEKMFVPVHKSSLNEFIYMGTIGREDIPMIRDRAGSRLEPYVLQWLEERSYKLDSYERAKREMRKRQQFDTDYDKWILLHENHRKILTGIAYTISALNNKRDEATILNIRG